MRCVVKDAKCAKVLDFPPAQGPDNNTIMATLGDFLSTTQKATLKADAVKATKARKLKAKSEAQADHTPDKVWDMLYDIAYEMGQRISQDFWSQINTYFWKGTEHVICLKGHNEHQAMPVTRHTTWAKHLGEMLKAGYRIVYVRANGFATEVTWDNWKRIYRTLTTQPENNGYDVMPTKREIARIRTARRKEKEFYDLARPIRAKKGGRMRISFAEARDQRVKAERVDFECKVVRRASKILEVL